MNHPGPGVQRTVPHPTNLVSGRWAGDETNAHSCAPIPAIAFSLSPRALVEVWPEVLYQRVGFALAVQEIFAACLRIGSWVVRYRRQPSRPEWCPSATRISLSFGVGGRT